MHVLVLHFVVVLASLRMSLVGSAILLILADFACTSGDLSSDEGPCVRENLEVTLKSYNATYSTTGKVMDPDKIFLVCF